MSRADKEARREEYKRVWSRGRVLEIKNTHGIGKEFDSVRYRNVRDKHYWVLVSSNLINWNTDMRIIAVPMVTHRAHTIRAPHDVEFSKEESPTDRALVVLCGDIRAMDRIRKITPTNWMFEMPQIARIEEKLIQVLQLGHWMGDNFTLD